MPQEAGSAAALHDVLRQAEGEKGWSGVVKPLPPGKYLVVACDLETDGTAEPILKLWRQRSKAKPVEIGPGETAQITLEIVGPANSFPLSTTCTRIPGPTSAFGAPTRPSKSREPICPTRPLRSP